jgi:hypothetical protein
LVDELIAGAASFGGWTEERYPGLTEYYRMLHKKRKSFTRLREKLPVIKKAEGAIATEVIGKGKTEAKGEESG